MLIQLSSGLTIHFNPWRGGPKGKQIVKVNDQQVIEDYDAVCRRMTTGATFRESNNRRKWSMSEVKHTPGPWVVADRIHRDSGCIPIHTERGEVIATAWALLLKDGSDPKTPKEANARLLAAAPDLLAAAKSVLKDYECFLDNEGDRGWHLRMLREAIRKAEEVPG